MFEGIKEYFERDDISLKTATGMLNNLNVSRDELVKSKDIVRIKNYVKEKLLEYCIKNNIKDSSTKILMEDYDNVFGKVMDDDLSVVIVKYNKYSFEDFKKEIEFESKKKEREEL